MAPANRSVFASCGSCRTQCAAETKKAQQYAAETKGGDNIITACLAPEPHARLDRPLLSVHSCMLPKTSLKLLLGRAQVELVFDKRVHKPSALLTCTVLQQLTSCVHSAGLCSMRWRYSAPTAAALIRAPVRVSSESSSRMGPLATACTAWMPYFDVSLARACTTLRAAERVAPYAAYSALVRSAPSVPCSTVHQHKTQCSSQSRAATHGKDDGALLGPLRVGEERLSAVLRIHQPYALLRKGKCARRVCVQAL